jgi:hypothetical protein
MRVAINLLTDDPGHPSGAHWFWTRVIPEMARRLAETLEMGAEFLQNSLRVFRMDALTPLVDAIHCSSRWNSITTYCQLLLSVTRPTLAP